jgi:GntR family transcriptional regulator
MSEKPNIRFRLVPGRGVAPYRQLVEQVNKAVSSGHLKPGDRLPPVREVIKQITINPNTVYRAYRELEYLGIAETQWGVGTFIRSPITQYGKSNCPPSIIYSLAMWIDGARSSGVSDEEITQMVVTLLRNSIGAMS